MLGGKEFVGGGQEAPVIALYARGKEAFLREFSKLEHGLPDPATCRGRMLTRKRQIPHMKILLSLLGGGERASFLRKLWQMCIGRREKRVRNRERYCKKNFAAHAARRLTALLGEMQMPRPPKSILMPALCAGTFLGLSAGLAHAAEPAPTPPPANWWDTFTIGGTVEAGVTLNGANPGDGLNFGHLFTDKANTPLLNQILLTAQRPLDPKATGYDLGFKLQVMYGSDARYVHYLGEGDYWINELNQITPIEAWGVVHTPWLFSGGIDVKAGQFVTLEGAEVIDPTGDYLYSHSYIFNFGIPFDHTGIMTISHVDPLLDIYAGITTGVNTTFGGDNNAHPSFHGGIGLNLLGGNLTILATTHIGPVDADTNGTNNTIDNFTACGCNPNNTLRFLNDITATWKINDSWTLMTDLNYIHDDGTFTNASGFGTFHPNGYGIAQYAIYTVNEWLKAVGRVEVWRDNNNFFVAAFPGNFDFVNAEHGFLNTSIAGGPLGAGTTYFEITGGLNIAPTLPKDTPLIQSITFRPEVRYDASLNDTTPFDGVNVPGGRGFPGFGAGAKGEQFTFGGDIIAKF